MTRRTMRASAAALGCAALLALAGCGGGGGGGGGSTTTAQSASAQGGAQQQQGQRPGGFFSQDNVSKLAKELGVSTSRLQQAIAAARPAGAGNGPPGGGQGAGRPPGGGGGGGGFRGQLAANLAKQLNMPTTKVEQALAKVLPGRPQGAASQAPSSSPS